MLLGKHKHVTKDHNRMAAQTKRFSHLSHMPAAIPFDIRAPRHERALHGQVKVRLFRSHPKLKMCSGIHLSCQHVPRRLSQ